MISCLVPVFGGDPNKAWSNWLSVTIGFSRMEGRYMIPTPSTALSLCSYVLDYSYTLAFFLGFLASSPAQFQCSHSGVGQPGNEATQTLVCYLSLLRHKVCTEILVELVSFPDF